MCLGFYRFKKPFSAERTIGGGRWNLVVTMNQEQANTVT